MSSGVDDTVAEQTDAKFIDASSNADLLVESDEEEPVRRVVHHAVHPRNIIHSNVDDDVDDVDEPVQTTRQIVRPTIRQRLTMRQVPIIDRRTAEEKAADAAEELADSKYEARQNYIKFYKQQKQRERTMHLTNVTLASETSVESTVRKFNHQLILKSMFGHTIGVGVDLPPLLNGQKIRKLHIQEFINKIACKLYDSILLHVWNVLRRLPDNNLSWEHIDQAVSVVVAEPLSIEVRTFAESVARKYNVVSEENEKNIKHGSYGVTSLSSLLGLKLKTYTTRICIFHSIYADTSESVAWLSNNDGNRKDMHSLVRSVDNEATAYLTAFVEYMLKKVISTGVEYMTEHSRKVLTASDIKNSMQRGCLQIEGSDRWLDEIAS